MLSLYCIPGMFRQLTRLFVRCLGYNIRCKNSLTWQPKKENALSTTNPLCQEIESPDITGQLHAADGAINMAYPLGFDVQTIGAISVAKTSSWMNKYAGAFNKNNGSVAIFTASASNKYYGESTWVQPASFYTLTIIKI